MTIDPEFLRLLACPASKQPLRLATDAELQQLNAAIARGGVHNRGGAAVERPLQQGLVSVAEPLLYPIQDDIPILLTAEAIPLPSAANPPG